jgi:hypothetical protein
MPTSIYTGVSFIKKTCKWEAHIVLLQKKKYIGIYETEEEAAIAHDEYAVFYDKQRTNFDRALVLSFEQLLELIT